MTPIRSPLHENRTRSTTAIAGLLALLAGCAEEWGPESPVTTAISGRLTVQGRPPGRCWIELQPVDGTVGPLRSAQVDRDGNFATDRVPVGTVAIRVVALPPVEEELPHLARYFQQIRQVYLIRRTIAPGPGSWLEIDLATEATRRLREP